MKTLYAVTIVAFLIGCASSKKYDDSPTTNSVEKLVKKYNRKPADTALLNKLVYSFNLLHNQYLNEAEALMARNTPQSWEAAANLYSRLNDLNSTTAQNDELFTLLNPKSYITVMENARLEAADGYYNLAIDYLDNNHWSSAREASNYLNKVKNLAGNFRDINQLIPQAREAATVDILVQPLQTDGYYFNSGYMGNQSGYRLADQLVNDMGGQWNNNGRYRVYASGRYNNGNNKEPDWVAEPVWTYWRINPVQYHTYNRTVSRQKQTGTDTLNRPIYRTVSALLTITESTINAEGHLELRITDVKDNSSVGRRNWNENYTWKQAYATYSGDGDALTPDDWNLVRQQRNNQRLDEDQIQMEILQRIYPDMLRWFKNMAD